MFESKLTVSTMSEWLETFAKSVGYYAFNRWAAKSGYPIEQTKAVVKNVFKVEGGK